MKIKSALVVVFIIVSIIQPVDLVFPVSDKNDTVLITLNVCDTKGSFLSLNTDMPSIYEFPCNYVTLEFANFYEP